jgi:hypothetical protein
MDVNINNLRKQAAYSLDKVIKTLNNGILPEKTFSSHDVDGKSKQFEGDVLINKNDIQKNIDELRSNIWVLLCVYDDKDPDFKCVYEEVENSGGIARFNEDIDEEEC